MYKRWKLPDNNNAQCKLVGTDSSTISAQGDGQNTDPQSMDSPNGLLLKIIF